MSAGGSLLLVKDRCVVWKWASFLEGLNLRHPGGLQPTPLCIKAMTLTAGRTPVASQLMGECCCAVVSNETPVSEPVIKTSAFLQATGEAKYTCDLPFPQGGGLEGAYVLSTRAAAKFECKWLPGRFPSSMLLIFFHCG